MPETNTTVVQFPQRSAPEPAPVAPVASAVAPVVGPTMAPNVMVTKYLALRDKKAEVVKRHKEETDKFDLAMATLEGWLLDILNNANAQSMKVADGTYYKSTKISATVNEWSKTLAYIRENDAWELLEARVSKTAVEAIIAETGAVPPGVKISSMTGLNVRRA